KNESASATAAEGESAAAAPDVKAAEAPAASERTADEAESGRAGQRVPDAPAGQAARTPPVPPAEIDDQPKPHASPSVRKFARELGVDLQQVQGTGAKNRITQDDVRSFVK